MSGPELQTPPDDLRQLYAEAQRLHEELQALETVDQARAAYDVLLGGEEHQLESRRQRVAGLEREKQLMIEQMELAGVEDADGYAGVDESWGVRGKEKTKGEEEGKVKPVEPRVNPLLLTQARKRFQRLVNQYKYLLQVSDTVCARINQIVEDPQRPLGEALVLLGWNAFIGRMGPPGAESDDKYRERLNEWQASLREYVEKAAGDVRATEMMYGAKVMRLWRAWRAVESGDGAQWEQLIENTRRALKHQAAEFEKQLATLEAELAELKDGRGGVGNHGW
jgi:hypothetical protein